MVIKSAWAFSFCFSFTDFQLETVGKAFHITFEVEKKDFELLRKLFGNAVEIKKGTWAAKMKKSFEKRVRLPF